MVKLLFFFCGSFYIFVFPFVVHFIYLCFRSSHLFLFLVITSRWLRIRLDGWLGLTGPNQLAGRSSSVVTTINWISFLEFHLCLYPFKKIHSLSYKLTRRRWIGNICLYTHIIFSVRLWNLNSPGSSVRLVFSYNHVPLFGSEMGGECKCCINNPYPWHLNQRKTKLRLCDPWIWFNETCVESTTCINILCE